MQRGRHLLQLAGSCAKHGRAWQTRCAASAQEVGAQEPQARPVDYDVYNPDGKKGLNWVSDRLERRMPYGRVFAAVLAGVGIGVTAWAFTDPEKGKYTPDVDFTNWSATHSVKCARVYEPETEEEVVRLMQKAIGEGWTLRVVGSAISPNALSFSSKCMISMGLMDKVLDVDTEKMQVRVQAGAKVQDVVEAIRPYGLTLQNYASIRDQQIGGFTQVSAHGTGAGIPPVDEQVISLRIVSPGLGNVVEMNRGSDPAFPWASVGLGGMGAVTEVTLQCVRAHRLEEKTFVATRAEVRRQHKRWVRQNKHIRYMWIPSTDTVVVVQCNETNRSQAPGPGLFQKGFTNEQRLEPLRQLASELHPEGAATDSSLTAMQLRDVLLAAAPLDKEWVKRVNVAEAEFWQRSAGYRVGWSDELLGFDCGGQQWVLEVAFPTGGTKSAPSTKDLDYMEELLALIEEAGVPAPAPIEQRWTASSSAPMSPAHSSNPDDVHSWVGIIMYLPTDDPQTRSAITAKFQEYGHLVEQKLMPKYGAKWHWAKLEPEEDSERLEWIRQHLREQYPVRMYNQVRHALDPENNLGNSWLNSVLPLTRG